MGVRKERADQQIGCCVTDAFVQLQAFYGRNEVVMSTVGQEHGTAYLRSGLVW